MLHRLNASTIIATSDKTELVICRDLGSTPEYDWYSFGFLHSDGFSVSSNEVQYIIDMLEELKNATK